MNNRYLGAVILAPILILLFLGGIYLKALVVILSLLGMYEFYSVVKQKNIKPISIVGYIMCIVHYIILIGNYDIKINMYLFIASVFIMLCIPVINLKYDFNDVAITILGFLYSAVFFSFILLLDIKNHGNYFIWLIFIASWVGDTGAYYAGRYLGKDGKHKLCPKVSPKKTVEGFIGGLIGSVAGCTVYGYIIGKYGVDIELYHYAVIGVLGGIAGVFGDLVASSIKRKVGVKDYSNLIPGHGGILDRFDSILFVSVVIYYYITFIVGM